jgi:hypothetical protein
VKLKQLIFPATADPDVVRLLVEFAEPNAAAVPTPTVVPDDPATADEDETACSVAIAGTFVAEDGDYEVIWCQDTCCCR